MHRILVAAAAAFMVGSSGGAQAATFNLVDVTTGNECKGGSFESCTYNGSPTIASYGFRQGSPTFNKNNNVAFPSIDGFEFDVTPFSNTSGNWSYAPRAGDPLVITAFMLKIGQKRYVYEWDVNSGADFSSISWDIGQSRRALKRITFFDTNRVAPIPLPAAGFMLMAGLAGLVGLRRRRKS